MKMSKGRLQRLLGFAVAGMALVGRRARPSPKSGIRRPWEVGRCSKSATPVMDYIRWFHDYVLVIITVITLFVMALLHLRDGEVQRQGQPGPEPRPRTTPASKSPGRWCRC